MRHQRQQQALMRQQQQQSMMLQVQNMRLQTSLQAKRAVRARVAEKQAGGQQAEMLQQVALQSVQLQALMLRQMSGGGPGMMLPIASEGRAPQRALDQQPPSQQSPPDSVAAAAAATTATASYGAHDQEQGLSLRDARERTTTLLGEGPATDMREIRPDDLDLDLLLPADGEAASAAGDDGNEDVLAELGVERMSGLSDEDEKLDGVRRFRARVHIVIFVRRCWKLLSGELDGIRK